MDVRGRWLLLVLAKVLTQYLEDGRVKHGELSGERLKGLAGWNARKAGHQLTEIAMDRRPVGIHAVRDACRNHLGDVTTGECGLLSQQIERLALLGDRFGETSKVIGAGDNRAEVKAERLMNVSVCRSPSIAFSIWAIAPQEKAGGDEGSQMPTER